MTDYLNPKLGVCFILVLILSSQFCVFSSITDGNALKDKIDSLKFYIAPDTNRVNFLSTIAWQYRYKDYVLAKKYFHSAEILAEKLHYKKGIITINSRLGVICVDKGEYDSAIYFHLKCLKFKESIHDNAGIARSYENLGVVYQKLNDSTKAVFYFQKSLAIISKSGNTVEVGTIYLELGNIYLAYSRFDLARSNYIKALSLFIKANDKENLAKIYSNIGATYFTEGNPKKALAYLYKNAEIQKSLNNAAGLADAYDNIAGVYVAINKDSAIYYFNVAIPLAKKAGSLSSLMEIYNNLTAYYQKQHEYEKAFKTYGLYDDVKDSIYSIEKSKAIAEMQTKYETEKKEEQIAILTKDEVIQKTKTDRQRWISWSLGVGLFLILIISFILYRGYRFERNAMKTIRSEKERSDELLLNILPAETAQELIKYGKTTAKNYDEVSVMFADIKGFTKIAETMTAAALVEDLDQYFGAFDLIIEKYGLEKIKTIGDAYLCAGGLTGPEKGTPGDVVKAALEMQHYLEKEKQEKSDKNLSFFEVRIGINTGPVVAGVVGIKKFAYDIWGDTVNTAARMEQFGEIGKVNISEYTHSIIKDNFNCTFRGNIEVKSKGMVAMYFVESVKEISDLVI